MRIRYDSWSVSTMDFYLGRHNQCHFYPTFTMQTMKWYRLWELKLSSILRMLCILMKVVMHHHSECFERFQVSGFKITKKNIITDHESLPNWAIVTLGSCRFKQIRTWIESTRSFDSYGCWLATADCVFMDSTIIIISGSKYGSFAMQISLICACHCLDINLKLHSFITMYLFWQTNGGQSIIICVANQMQANKKSTLK